MIWSGPPISWALTKSPMAGRKTRTQPAAAPCGWRQGDEEEGPQRPAVQVAAGLDQRDVHALQRRVQRNDHEDDEPVDESGDHPEAGLQDVVPRRPARWRAGPAAPVRRRTAPRTSRTSAPGSWRRTDDDRGDQRVLVPAAVDGDGVGDRVGDDQAERAGDQPRSRRSAGSRQVGRVGQRRELSKLRPKRGLPSGRWCRRRARRPAAARTMRKPVIQRVPGSIARSTAGCPAADGPGRVGADGRPAVVVGDVVPCQPAFIWVQAVSRACSPFELPLRKKRSALRSSAVTRHCGKGSTSAA